MSFGAIPLNTLASFTAIVSQLFVRCPQTCIKLPCNVIGAVAIEAPRQHRQRHVAFVEQSHLMRRREVEDVCDHLPDASDFGLLNFSKQALFLRAPELAVYRVKGKHRTRGITDNSLICPVGGRVIVFEYRCWHGQSWLVFLCALLTGMLAELWSY